MKVFKIWFCRCAIAICCALSFWLSFQFFEDTDKLCYVVWTFVGYIVMNIYADYMHIHYDEFRKKNKKDEQ